MYNLFASPGGNGMRAHVSYCAYWIESLEPRRLLAAGSLDTSFADGGVLDLPATVPARLTTAATVALPGGKSLVVSNRDSGAFVLSRFDASGSPDASFGDDGSITVAPSVVFEFGTGASNSGAGVAAAAVDGQGRIYVAVFGADPEKTAIDRFNPDGSIDRSFGTAGGIDLNPLQSNSLLQTVTSLSLGPDGSIYVGGYTLRHAHNHHLLQILAIEKLFGDGKVDPHYGAGGVATAQFYQRGRFLNSVANAITIDPTGKVLVAGGSSAWYDVVRFSTAGKLDSSFGSNGEARFRGDGGDNGLTCILLRSDGDILVGGGQPEHLDARAPGGELVVAALKSSGRFDAIFGNAGVVRISAGSDGNGDPLDAQAAGMTITTTGQLIVVGNVFNRVSSSSPDNGIILASLNADGSADLNFGNDVAGDLPDVPGGQAPAGWKFVSTPTPYQPGRAVGIAAAFAGRFYVPFAGTLGRSLYPRATELFFNPDGFLDTNFGEDGVAITGPQITNYPSIDAIAAGAMGLVATHNGYGESDLYAIDDAGTLSLVVQEPAASLLFGSVTSARVPVAAQPDGKLLVAYQKDTETVELYRVAADGTVDETFGNNGFVTFTGSSLTFNTLTATVGANGEILARFTTGGIYAVDTDTLYLLDPAGNILAHKAIPLATIAGFGGPPSTFAGAAVTADGKIVQAVLTTGGISGAVVDEYSVTRFNADFSVDTTFGTNGSAPLPPGTEIDSVKTQPGGRILLGGSEITALTSGGAVDSTFGQNGTLALPASISNQSDDNWAVQANGEILFAYLVHSVLRVQRFTANGVLDSSFGDAGTATFYIHVRSDFIGPMIAIQQTVDGEKLLIVGQVQGYRTIGDGLTPYVIRVDL